MFQKPHNINVAGTLSYLRYNIPLHFRKLPVLHMLRRLTFAWEAKSDWVFQNRAL